jgi:sugar lactone lactonase YvrE
VGGVVWRLAPGGIIGRFAAPDDGGGFLAPDDIALDADGFVYVSDRGRQQVWRFNSDGGDSQAWWRSPAVPNADSYAPTGLAYDPIHDAIIITDPEVNAIYRVAVADGNTETLYLHGDRPYQPGFDGVTVTPDGTLYVAALGQNGIARLREGELEYIAGLFRGASDVAHDGNDRLYVTNFDQFSLLVSVVSPRLPFALDVITLD